MSLYQGSGMLGPRLWVQTRAEDPLSLLHLCPWASKWFNLWVPQFSHQQNRADNGTYLMDCQAYMKALLQVESFGLQATENLLPSGWYNRELYYRVS